MVCDVILFFVYFVVVVGGGVVVVGVVCSCWFVFEGVEVLFFLC